MLHPTTPDHVPVTWTEAEAYGDLRISTQAWVEACTGICRGLLKAYTCLHDVRPIATIPSPLPPPPPSPPSHPRKNRGTIEISTATATGDDPVLWTHYAQKEHPKKTIKHAVHWGSSKRGIYESLLTQPHPFPAPLTLP